MKLLRVVPGLFLLTVMLGWEVGIAQQTDTKWLVGVWRGAHSGRNVSDDMARFEFKEEEGKIKWKMVRTGQIFGQRGEWEASGIVVKISESSVDLDGKYDWSNFPSIEGQPLKYSLTRSGDSLEGYGLGALNVPFPLSLEKVK